MEDVRGMNEKCTGVHRKSKQKSIFLREMVNSKFIVKVPKA